jgi:hypothetical protein
LARKLLDFHQHDWSVTPLGTIESEIVFDLRVGGERLKTGFRIGGDLNAAVLRARQRDAGQGGG